MSKEVLVIDVGDDDDDADDDNLGSSTKNVGALPPPQYILELAKSNRSECKRCSKRIEKAELRVGVINEGEWGLFTKWFEII